jgi:hypothetical protein
MPVRSTDRGVSDTIYEREFPHYRTIITDVEFFDLRELPPSPRLPIHEHDGLRLVQKSTHLVLRIHGHMCDVRLITHIT